jgi:hypothetical protein
MTAKSVTKVIKSVAMLISGMFIHRFEIASKSLVANM